MDKFDRIQQLHRILKSHRLPVAKRKLAEELECTEKTVQRYMDILRDLLNAPLTYSKEHRGWHYTPGDDFELPGLWLTAGDMQSLSILLTITEKLSDGLLNNDFNLIEKQIDKLLRARGLSKSGFIDKLKILPQATRHIPHRNFQTTAEALLLNRRLEINYTNYRQQKTRREISPLTLVYYRENWYLDAWCHLRKDLRTFSVSRIDSSHLLETPLKDIPNNQRQAYFSSSYGIFSGKPKHTAKLRFLSSIAREIACQNWHPDQIGEWDGDEYLLTIPYSDDRELIQDILRHTPNVYIESPVKLRRKVAQRLASGIGVLTGKNIGWV